MPTRKRELTEQTFEESLRRLEKIVEQLEGGEVPLDESMRLYEEGIALSKLCGEKLSKAELTLKRLAKDIEGNFRLLDEEPGEEQEE